MHWNLPRLAEAMLPLLGDTDNDTLASAQETLAAFRPRFKAAYLGGLRRKLGLGVEQEGDAALVQDLLAVMTEGAADFTLTFRRLCAAAADPAGDTAVRSLFTDGEAFDGWTTRWHARLAQEPATPDMRAAAMRAVNPAVIPRNHLVKAALTAALQREDFGPFEALLDATFKPFEERSGFEHYALPPERRDRTYQTFCGT